jgi:hypothetical protein
MDVDYYIMCYKAIMDKDDVLNFRVPSDLKAALRKAAENDERSMSLMAVRILRDWLAEKGYYETAKSNAPARRTRR